MADNTQESILKSGEYLSRIIEAVKSSNKEEEHDEENNSTITESKSNRE